MFANLICGVGPGPFGAFLNAIEGWSVRSSTVTWRVLFAVRLKRHTRVTLRFLKLKGSFLQGQFSKRGASSYTRVAPQPSK